MTTGRINQGASSCVLFVKNAIARDGSMDDAKIFSVDAYERLEAVSNVGTRAMENRRHTPYTRITRVSRRMVKPEYKSGKTVGTLAFDSYQAERFTLKETNDLGARYATSALRTQRHRGNYRFKFKQSLK